MSYDYNALVASIAAHRRNATKDEAGDAASHLQKAVDSFVTLSSHCPMTPLLWMQYAHDTGNLMQHLLPDQPHQAAETRLQTLELGLAEFPGCALLHLHYLQLLLKQKDSDGRTDTAFQKAIASVGRGSHRNEGHLVAAIYRLYAEFLVDTQSDDAIVINLFVQRARTPIKDANDGLINEVQQFCQSNNIELSLDDVQRIEDGRRWTAKTFDSLAVNEDDVDVAMHAERVLTRHEFSHKDMDWEALLKSEAGRLWMGFGGAQTANAFIQYAKACSYYSVPKHEFENGEEKAKIKQDLVHSLAVAVYERGVGECPTVETLWLSYLRHLMYLLLTKNPLASISQLESVTSRAARNCPYSIQLVQQKLKTALISAEAGQVVFDPDSVTNIVNDAIKSSFIPDPASQLELHMTAIRTVKRRIMSILARASGVKYDDAIEQNGKKNATTDEERESDMGEAAEQEIQDLAEDIRDMYETADTFLRKSHTSWSEGRTVLWRDRAMTETHLLEPLLSSLESNGESIAREGLRCLEKLVKVHQPPHPDSYALYIRELMKKPSSTPQQVMRNLQTARSLFQKSLRTVGKARETPEKTSSTQRDRNAALQSLCYDYLEFEQLFGSDESYVEASKAVRKKFETLVSNWNQQEDATRGGDVALSDTKISNDESALRTKRFRSDEDDSGEPSTKKPRPSVPVEDTEMDDASLVDEQPHDKAASVRGSIEKPKKHPVHKVHVGKLDYPAHPFTVRVSNLSSETEDMDLIDLFRPKCGAVVHAKVVREKQHHHGKGKSKGWGLVQFEERDSVDKALELNDVIGIHERVVRVDRSHVPAVGLVPPGMHRVKPRGEGKSSKRNQKRREEKRSKDDEAAGESERSRGEDGGNGAPKGEISNPKQAGSAGILAFRPRGVARAHAHGNSHRKVKLSLNDKESKS